MKAKPPYIIQVPRLWGTTVAITLYPFIFTLDKNDETVMSHELIHIEQVNRGWIIGFYLKYLYYQIRYGYKNNPYEIEAYKKQ